MTPWFNLPNAADCGWRVPTNHDKASGGLNVAVIGAGIAGLSAARALQAIGYSVTVFDASHQCATGASASPAGIVKQYVTRQPSDAMRFYQNAYAVLMAWLNELGTASSYRPIGALQLKADGYQSSDVLQTVNAELASDIAKVSIKSSAVWFTNAGWLSVRTLCEALMADLKTKGATFKPEHMLNGLKRENNHWQLNFQQQPPAFFEQVVLANGTGLLSNQWLPSGSLIPARGQLTGFKNDTSIATVISGQHYAIPDRDTLWVGATFDRGDSCDDVRAADDERNHDGLSDLLTQSTPVNSTPTSHYVGVRCTTVDRFPLVGPMPDFDAARNTYHDLHHGRDPSQYPTPNIQPGLAILAGLGSRGVVAAPYCASLLADWLTGGQQLRDANRWVSPLRHLIRELKRQT